MPSSACGDHLDAERRQQAAELAQLAGVAGGEDEAGRLDHAGAECAALRYLGSAPSACSLRGDQLAMPCSASASSASISARVNGAPSAVPCTSTKPPAPVITTFMSVSQPESSA